MSRKAKQRRNQGYTDNNLIEFSNYIQKQVNLIPRNLNQETYIDLLLDTKNIITFAIGPAGTGKTMLGVLAAIRALKARDIDRIVITRPAVGVDNEQHGFLPGDLNRKMEPWTRPIFDVFQEYYSPKQIKDMIDNNIIEISPLAFMRGRTFKNSYIIADEMQNATPNQMKMLLTRIGDDSRMVVTGDVQQTDRPGNANGLVDFRELFNNFKEASHIAMCFFNYHDVERHPVVKEVLEIYGDK